MSANLWAELDRLPVHHRLALAAEIIKRDRPSLRMLAKAAGLNPDTFSQRLHRERAIATPVFITHQDQRRCHGIGDFR